MTLAVFRYARLPTVRLLRVF